MKELENYRYSIVKKNGQLHPDKKHISKKEAEKALAISKKRGWNWTIKRHNDKEMEMFAMINAWHCGVL